MDKKYKLLTVNHRSVVAHLLRHACAEANPYLAQSLFAEARAWLACDAAKVDALTGFDVAARKTQAELDDKGAS